MAKKPSRDPGAPKRNLSAYLLYQNAMRDQFKALNPGMVGLFDGRFTSCIVVSSNLATNCFQSGH